MNADPLIRELQAAGVTLSAIGDRLHVQAPAAIVTPELRQRIAENKTLLLAELHKPRIAAPDDTRAALLVLADQLGLDRAAVVRSPAIDLQLWAAIPADVLPAFLLALTATVTRQGGKVPPGDTAPIHCAHCGPVYVHPDIAAVLPVAAGWPRALGCPWCAIRAAGGHIPRPPVTGDLYQPKNRPHLGTNPHNGVDL